MYCTTCGKEIADDAVVCLECGCAVESTGKNKSVIADTTKENTPKTATVLGIIGIVVAWFLALAGHIVSIIGIVIGIKEYKKTERISGLVLSIVGELCSILSSIIGAVLVSSIY